MSFVFRRSAVMLLAAILTLAVQEFAVRFALPDFDPAAQLRFLAETETAPPLGPPNERFRLMKNSGDYNVEVTFNRHGLRDHKDIAGARDTDLILTGDSFALGWGVEENERISEQLEAELRRRVFNLASPTGLDGYLKLLQYAETLGSRAKDVILVFNMSNDIGNYDAPVVKAESAPGHSQMLQRTKDFLLGHSALYFLATYVASQTQWVHSIAVRLGLSVPLNAVIPREIDDAAIASTINLLKQIGKQWRLTVLVVPSRGVWIGNRVSTEQKIHQRFIAALEQNAIRYVDMKPIQERDGNPMRFHFANDGHWRPSGHALAAHVLAAKILATI